MTIRPRFSLRKLNIALNQKEFEEKKGKLFSTPRLVTLGAHNACNAGCIFCLKEENYPRFDLKIYKELFDARMGHFIRNAEKVTFTGFGEVLLIPGIENFLDYINKTLPETEKIITTNGTPLLPSVAERFAEGRYCIQISLHASRADLHREMTNLQNHFDRILDNIRYLIRLREKRSCGKNYYIELLNILTTRNIDDLPDFLRLAWKLRVQTVCCRYMDMFVPDHIDLSCFFDQKRANRALAAARLVLKKLRAEDPSNPLEVSLPPLFGERASREKTICYDPWQHIYVETQGSILPCCSWGEHISNLGREGIDQVWNGQFYRALRKGMAGGNPHPWCKSCMRYKGYNVNNILCHITNRRGPQKTILNEIAGRKNEVSQPAMNR